LQQLKAVWSGLEPRKRIIAVGAATLMFLAVLGLSRMAASPSFALLYAGLEPNVAGDVIQALDARGTPYEIRGDAIYVPQPARDRLRLTLASQGLPANGAQGYELLDSLTGFGTTAQMFDAAYWRAKEGELARTISASRHIKSARVHIAHSGGNPFRRDISPSASVTVTSARGALSGAQAEALEYLVASAVPGLVPEDVAIIAADGTLVNGADPGAPADRQEAMRARVQRILEARVGRGNAIVELSMERVVQSEVIRERRFDPQSRVVISTDTEETSRTTQNAADAGVSVASNLPDGDAAGTGESSSRNNRTRERVNYEVSETERRITREAGAIRRLTVAILVNAKAPADTRAGTDPVVRSDAELAALRELVASAVGYDEARGDVITVKSMAFDPADTPGTPPAAPGVWERLDLDPMTLLQIAVLAVVSLILGLFVLRPLLLSSRAAPGRIPALAHRGNIEPAGAEDAESAPAALTGEIDQDGAGGSTPALVMARPHTGDSQDPVERLKALIAERQTETLEILQSWLEEAEGEAR
jgi:flagellar M-ring protein FliF